MENKRIPLTVKKMKTIAILGCALGDFLIFILTYFTLTAQDVLDNILQLTLAQKNIDPAMLAKQDILGFYQLMTNTVLTMLIIYIVFHSIIYLLFYKDKATARGYVSMYALVGAFGAGATGLGMASNFSALAIPMIIQAVLYGISFKMLRDISKSLESENA